MENQDLQEPEKGVMLTVLEAELLSFIAKRKFQLAKSSSRCCLLFSNPQIRDLGPGLQPAN